MKKQCCIICGKSINDGIIISGTSICRGCEERIIKIDNNNDFYEHYKNCIRKTITQTLIKGEDISCQSFHL